MSLISFLVPAIHSNELVTTELLELFTMIDIYHKSVPNELKEDNNNNTNVNYNNNTFHLFETTHPYSQNNNMEQMFTLNGATCLLVWFDPLCNIFN